MDWITELTLQLAAETGVDAASLVLDATEAALWGTFLEQRLDEFGGKAKIAALRINNDFGASYHAALETYLENSPRKDDISYESITFEPSAVVVKDEMTTLAADSPDMFIAMTTGASCAQATSFPT